MPRNHGNGSITFGYVTNREGYTTIFVEDTGSGISEDAQKHIFERFTKKTALRRAPVWAEHFARPS